MMLSLLSNVVHDNKGIVVIEFDNDTKQVRVSASDKLKPGQLPRLLHQLADMIDHADGMPLQLRR